MEQCSYRLFPSPPPSRLRLRILSKADRTKVHRSVDKRHSLKQKPHLHDEDPKRADSVL